MKKVDKMKVPNVNFSTSYSEDEWLQLSGIQHYAFCARQWALIHIEQQWIDNYLTTAGSIEHERVDDYQQSESRGNLLILRNLRVFNPALGISGMCDVVEFHSNPCGIHLTGRRGSWIPYPVEYKHGKPKENDADRLQLCAEAMCLEYMLSCDIPLKVRSSINTQNGEKLLHLLLNCVNKCNNTAGKCTTISAEAILPKQSFVHVANRVRYLTCANPKC